MAVKQPASKEVPINSFFNDVKKGDRAKPTKTNRALVAAEADMAASMRLPKGKLVPYKQATAANKIRGPR
jgi:hypothetical protein